MLLDNFAFPSVPPLCPRPGAASRRRLNQPSPSRGGQTCRKFGQQNSERRREGQKRKRERDRQTITTKLAGWAPAWEDLAQLHSVLTVAPLGTPAPVSAFRIHTQMSSHMGDTFTWTSQISLAGTKRQSLRVMWKLGGISPAPGASRPGKGGGARPALFSLLGAAKFSRAAPAPARAARAGLVYALHGP